MNDAAPRGYIGLIALLVVVAIVGFLFWGTDTFAPSQPATTPGDTSKPAQDSSYIERELNAVDSAKNAKQLIERGSATQQTELNY